MNNLDFFLNCSKEYELIQSKSNMLSHTSHHSHHPDNRHKNRYLNITACEFFVYLNENFMLMLNIHNFV